MTETSGNQNKNNPQTKKITTVQGFDPTTLTAECPFHVAMKDESGPLPGKKGVGGWGRGRKE